MRPPPVFLLLTMLAALLGCATSSWKPLDPAALKARPATTIGVVSAKVPSFSVKTMGRASMVVLGLAGAIIGTVAGETEGEQIIKGHHIADPARWIGSRLQVALATQLRLTPTTPTNLTTPTDTVIRWDTDLILTVATKSWAILPFQSRLNHYWVLYQASLELRDARDQRVLAAGDCKIEPPLDVKDSPTFDQLMVHGARGLKRKLSEAARTCAGEYARGLFGFRLAEDRIPDPNFVENPDPTFGSCHLEQTPAWQAADAAGKQRLLNECREQRKKQAPPAVPPPVAPPVPDAAPAVPPPVAPPVPDAAPPAP